MANLQQPSEVFKPIIGYEGLYEISNLGKVKSCERELVCTNPWGGKSVRTIPCIIKKVRIDRYGYETIRLSKKSKKKCFTIHQLVAIHFIPNPDNKPTVNHKDGIKINNSVDNLEWATVKEQMNHAFKNKLKTSPAFIHPGMLGKFGKNHNQSKAVLQLDLNGNLIKEWDCAVDASKLGFTRTHISRCCKGLAQSHKGYKWKFKP